MGSVVITGASSGFGRAAAKCFSEAGFDLVLVARRADRLAEVKAALSSKVDVLTIALDVRDKDDVLASLTALPDQMAEVSVLINSAGLALGLGGANDADLDDWDAMVDTNIKGLMYCTRAILPGMV
ncbi:MAG: SDR family NAD(P)-dependent oxidoreductase, partial [Gammaproteobacteria bacterium]|nr:SDR family NAD(P)-dependent oxidoreductase [Gammaproteobacteria bacterium]